MKFFWCLGVLPTNIDHFEAICSNLQQYYLSGNALFFRGSEKSRDYLILPTREYSSRLSPICNLGNSWLCQQSLCDSEDVWSSLTTGQGHSGVNFIVLWRRFSCHVLFYSIHSTVSFVNSLRIQLTVQKKKSHVSSSSQYSFHTTNVLECAFQYYYKSIKMCGDWRIEIFVYFQTFKLEKI